MNIIGKSSKEAFRRSGLGNFWSPPASSDNEAGPSKPRSSASPRKPESSLDISKTLYPTLRQHPEPLNHHVLVLSLSQISTVSPLITNDELFDVLLRRMEPRVGEEGEGGYVLTVLAADERISGDTRRWPGVGWWVWKYRRIPRKYRKNLKRLYIVHPSLFTRTLLPFIIPLLSPKSYSKLHPVPSLLSLKQRHGVSLAGIDLTLPVLEEEARQLRENPPGHTAASWTEAISSGLSFASTYLPIPRFSISSPNTKFAPPGGLEESSWRRSAEGMVAASEGKTPNIISTLCQVILEHCAKTEGIFRRSSNSTLLDIILTLLDLPPSEQPTFPWTAIAQQDALILPKILTRLLSQMQTPLIPPSLYPAIRSCRDLNSLRNAFLPSLSAAQTCLLGPIIQLLSELSPRKADHRMSALSFATVLAPCLISGPDTLQDAALCLEAGRSLPKAMTGGTMSSKTSRQSDDTAVEGGEEKGDIVEYADNGGTLVGVLDIWIRNYDQLVPPSSEKRSAPKPRRQRSTHSLLGEGTKGEKVGPEVSDVFA